MTNLDIKTSKTISYATTLAYEMYRTAGSGYIHAAKKFLLRRNLSPHLYKKGDTCSPFFMNFLRKFY